MPLVLVYKCPKCGKKEKMLHVTLKRHEACSKVKEGGKKPIFVLDEIDTNG